MVMHDDHKCAQRSPKETSRTTTRQRRSDDNEVADRTWHTTHIQPNHNNAITTTRSPQRNPTDTHHHIETLHVHLACRLVPQNSGGVDLLIAVSIRSREDRKKTKDSTNKKTNERTNKKTKEMMTG